MKFAPIAALLGCMFALAGSNLSAQVTVELLQNKTLRIRGTTNADTVIVDTVPGRVRVRSTTGSGIPYNIVRFPIDNVELIDVRLTAGNEIFNIFNNLNCAVVCNVYGEDGNDTISCGACADSCGACADSIFGGNGNDTILAGDGIDSCEGGQGNDYIDGQGGDDGIAGDAGVDVLIGGTGSDSLYGLDGNDLVIGAELSSGSVVSVKSIWLNFNAFSVKLAAFQSTPPAIVDDLAIDYLGGGKGADLFLGDFDSPSPFDEKIDFVDTFDKDNSDLIAP